jgi:glycosyltransferase involved in cell wall biosynthesis
LDDHGSIGSGVMNIAMVDPSLFTIAYDCELVHALTIDDDVCGPIGKANQPVVLYGRPLRPGELLSHPIQLVRQFYTASEMLPSTVRRAAKGIEHAVDMSIFAMRMALVRPEIIHFQWCPLPILDTAGITLLRHVAPMVLTVHDPNPYNGSDFGIMNRGARELPRLFDAVIVHSESGKSQVIRNGIDPAKTHVVPHGPLPVTASTRERDPGRDKFTLVFFGKIKPYKGLDTLVQALAKLPPDLKKKVHLVVVGEPVMDVSDIQSAATAAEISTSWELRFIPDEEIDYWLSQPDLFVFPYRDIDASGVFMSCLKYGKPVIATRIGMFGEVLQHGTHGYLIDPDEPAEAFTTAIADLMTHPERASMMGMEVGRLMNTLPSWQDIARSTMKVYSDARDRWLKNQR